MLAWAIGLLQLALAVQALHLYGPLVGALLDRLAPTTPPAPPAPPWRLAVLVAAHNEAAVIGPALEALRRQDYPRHAFDVYVVADHCTDGTAALARRAGATVFERNDGGVRTKGAALAALWRLVRQAGHDGVVVLDADNVAAPGFLAALSGALAAGHAAVQGLRRARGGGGTAPMDALTELCTHRIGAAGRVRLGLGAPLMGSGMAFSAAWFERLTAHVDGGVTEDCAWQAELALAGVAVHWTPAAVLLDEKTRTPAAMRVQRTRWLTGRGDVARRYVGPLLARFARTGSCLALDTALSLVAPPRALLALAVAGWTALVLCFPELPGMGPAWAWLGLTLAWPAYVAAGIWLDGGRLSDRRLWTSCLRHGPRFAGQMLAGSWRAVRGRRVAWIPTPHGPQEG